MTLSPAEVAALTRRDRPTAQARVLRALGIPYREHPTDGVLIVARAAAEMALGVKLEALAEPEPGQWDVDTEGIRGHGKAPASH